MNTWPPVTILLVTYNRPDEIRRTIQGLRQKIRYSGIVRVHVADDGSPAGYLSAIKNDFPGQISSVSVTDRGGWGCNVNYALRQLFLSGVKYIFVCEDDYVARKPLFLDPGVALLESSAAIGNVRYDGVEGHRLNLDLKENGATRIGKVHYLEIKKQGHDSYVYSNRPHLVHRRFHDLYGFYSESLALGSTELVFATQIRFTEGPAIVILPDGIVRAFDHIGKSWKQTTHDVGREIKQ